MTEQEKIDQFNRDVDDVLKGNAPHAETDPQRLDAARQLAAADFSAHSRARTTTRARLLARAHREIPVQNKRKEMNTRFSNVLRTLAFGAFLLMIVFGLGWVLSNTTPQVGVGLEGTPTLEPTVITEEPAIAFPRQPADWGSMDALMKGRLILADNCLRIEDSLMNTNSLLIWPHDYDWQIREGVVEVLDGAGQVVARVGDEISIGGGEADSLAGLGGGDSMQVQIPEACPGPYWLVGYGDIQLVEGESKVYDLVTGIGNTLQNVSLLSPTVVQDIQDNYAQYVSPDLLATWINDPSTAPGRRTSSPWPVGIEILIVTQHSPTEYGVTGNIVEVTSEEVVNGGRANEIPVQITLNDIQGTWMITSFVQDESNSSSFPTPLTLDSDSETIRQRILLSHTFWQALWVDAQINDYNGVASSQRVQVWVNQPAQARVLTGPVDGAPATLWISDGQMTRTGEDLSGYGLENFAPPMDESDTIYPHPMTGIMPTPLSSLLFPSGLAQRRGTYRPIAIETVAGRETLVVEWNRPDGPLTDRFWVDTVTGVILRQQNYGKGADGALTAEYSINSIQYDLAFPSETFNRLAAFPPAFATGPDDIYSGHANGSQPDESNSYLAQSNLNFQWTFTGNADEPNALASIYAGDQYVGQVDFGIVLSGGEPGGWCVRSYGGEWLAFAYRSTGVPEKLHWFNIKNLEIVYELSDFAAVMSMAFSPTDNQLVFTGCSDDGCGLWLLNISSGETRKLYFQGNMNSAPTLWSPDGKYVIFLPTELNSGAVPNNIIVLRVENGEVIYQGYAYASDSPVMQWKLSLPDFSLVNGTAGCETVP